MEKSEVIQAGKNSTMNAGFGMNNMATSRKKRRYVKRSAYWHKRDVPDGLQPATPIGRSRSLELGTNIGTQSRFTVKEIVDIINSCKQSNVRNFTYLGLHIDLGGTAISHQPKEFPETSERKTQEQSSNPRIQSFNQREDERATEMANLQLEDPMAFEQVMIDSMTGNTLQDEREIS